MRAELRKVIHQQFDSAGIQVKNFCKKSVAVAAIVMAASTGAQAANTSWGVHDSVEFGGSLLGKGSFEDTYSFSILGPSVLDTSGVVAFNIGSGSYSLLSMGGNNAIGGGDDTSLGSWSFFTPNQVSLANGNYYFDVKGTVGRFGGGYVIASSISPVPEPETYAMLMAGLGLMGLIAIRRKHKAS